ncbi:MAG: MaoC family dehydratase [Deltaproteobacteria bacterium]|nr:MaoC family dehydratase [Deltaproteobacteria bacterium]
MSTVLKTGDAIPALTKNAYAPIAKDARNPIHTDEYARQQGMRGALIPGSTLLSYVLEMLYNHFGEKWLYHGRINVSFIGGGAVNDDILTAQGRATSVVQEEDGARVYLDVWMVNQQDEKILVGEASCIP